jgi:hypothetical protein
MQQLQRRSLASVPGYRTRRLWRRAAIRLHTASMALLYLVFGFAGVSLWLLAQLPMSARWKETVVIAMAGCLGLFAAGWQLLRPSTAASR